MESQFQKKVKILLKNVWQLKKKTDIHGFKCLLIKFL